MQSVRHESTSEYSLHHAELSLVCNLPKRLVCRIARTSPCRRMSAVRDGADDVKTVKQAAGRRPPSRRRRRAKRIINALSEAGMLERATPGEEEGRAWRGFHREVCFHPDMVRLVGHQSVLALIASAPAPSNISQISVGTSNFTYLLLSPFQHYNSWPGSRRSSLQARFEDRNCRR